MPPMVRVLGLVLALAASQPASPEDFPSPFPPSDTLRQASWDEPATPEAQPGHPDEQVRSGPLPPPNRKPSLSLSPPSRSHQTPQGTRAGRTGLLRSLITVGSSLAVVLGLFFLVAWAMRRAAPRGSVLLPGEVVEVLGRAALATRGQVHVLRFGKKLLLVSVSPAGVETLAEITDREEVDRLAGLCRQAHPQSATAAFRHVFQQFTKHGTWEDNDV